MNKTNELPPQNGKIQAMPSWKVLLLIATMLAAAVCLFAFNVYIGGALFIAGIFFQTYGGFTTQPGVPGETRLRVANFVFAWVLCVLFAAGLQYAIPVFAPVHETLGPELPLATVLTNKIYRMTLLAPLFVGIAWHFWPTRLQRLRVAVTLGWMSIAAMAMMLGSMYLPLWNL